MNYGEILKVCRKRAGFSQEELGFKIGEDQASISRIEKDLKRLEVDTLLKWTNATSAQEITIALMLGVDGLTIMTEILGVVGTTVSGFINFLI